MAPSPSESLLASGQYAYRTSEDIAESKTQWNVMSLFGLGVVGITVGTALFEYNFPPVATVNLHTMGSTTAELTVGFHNTLGPSTRHRPSTRARSSIAVPPITANARSRASELRTYSQLGERDASSAFDMQHTWAPILLAFSAFGTLVGLRTSRIRQKTKLDVLQPLDVESPTSQLAMLVASAETKLAFELPPLPYGHGDLAPHISRETVEYHYGKHHRAYVNKLNELVVMPEHSKWRNKSLEAIMQGTCTTLLPASS